MSQGVTHHSIVSHITL